MDKLKRIVAMMLAVIMLVPSGIGSEKVVAEAGENTNSQEESFASEAEEKKELSDDDIPDALIAEVDTKSEIKDKFVKRLYEEEGDLNTLIFEKENGERTMYIFDKQVKYEDENGDIQDKDISFTEISEEYKSELSYRYVCDNGNNDINVYMPKNMADGIKITTDDKSVKMSLTDGNKNNLKVTVEEEQVVYDEAFGENTELRYTALLDGIKEEIVLEEYIGQTEYEFRLRLEGYELVTQDDNCLYLKDIETGEINGIIDSVYMIDDEGKTDFNNYYTYIERGNGVYDITAHVNDEFLTDADTKYPVIIDPTITIQKSNSTSGIYDATLNSTSTTAGTSGSLFVGNRSDGENGISRAVMKFPGLDFDANKVSVVISAKVSIRDIMCESEAITVGCLGLVGVSETWNETNVSWDYLEMDTDPYVTVGMDEKAVSYSEGIQQDTAHRYEFDITEVVMRWRKGTSSLTQGQGIIFKSLNEKSKVVCKTFASYNRASYNPVFTMEYVPYSGGWTLSDYKELVSQVDSDMYNPNCLGLALYSRQEIGRLEIGYSSVYNVRLLAEAIESYVNNGGRYASAYSKAEYLGCNGLKNIDYSLGIDEHLMAVRLYRTGNTVYLHAIVQMSDGRWVHKPGTSQIQVLGYINPDDTYQTCWKYAEDVYYNTSTAYIRLTK